MESTASPKIKIFLSRRDAEESAYHIINRVCQNYSGVVLEDYRLNRPVNFQKKTLEECALEDDIIVFLITDGKPSERQSLDDPRLKDFFQRGGKIWVFYKLLQPKTSDYQNGKTGPDRWYYERNDPKMYPNDDYIVSDYFGVDDKGYDQSLYAQFDILLSKYVKDLILEQNEVVDGNDDTSNDSDKGGAGQWRWIWAIIIILALFLLCMIARPDINRFFHPKPPVSEQDALVVSNGEATERMDSISGETQNIDRVAPLDKTNGKQQNSSVSITNSNFASDSSEIDCSQEDRENSEDSPSIISPDAKSDSMPSQLTVVSKPLEVGGFYNGERIVILNPDGKSGCVGELDISGPMSYPTPDELARHGHSWGLPTIGQMKQIFNNNEILNYTGIYWTSAIGSSRNKRLVVDFSKEVFTSLELKTSNDREAYVLLIKEFVIDK